ncbi:uncharacterized protein MYCFIDRAFT_208232 [Pseudocercospora fijiensis CIRAD86]|uniref:Major facilitator superfamily (MFS) profile domain-containing protein n=1 Tax=Pseudocercospora fijiensis (strain CIRAD86) TaxID=383855 RepID=M2ZPL6_PSEFD|nr:uncharacterized protein MYCFIDRAFT_208232 [Pseudocercospora fijiensis CIRAD86]EME81034.1 hypothetical protein MYCFIDRAFT_208232 [Pseudocercospora fijiensis CIRAD86]
MIYLVAAPIHRLAALPCMAGLAYQDRTELISQCLHHFFATLPMSYSDVNLSATTNDVHSKHHYQQNSAIQADHDAADEVARHFGKEVKTETEGVPDFPHDKKAGAEETRASQYPTGLKLWLLMLNLALSPQQVIANPIKCLESQITSTRVRTLVGIPLPFVSHSAHFNSCNHSPSRKTVLQPLMKSKRIFLVANIFSFLGSLLCGTAVSSTMLIIGRAAAGIGTAGLDAGAYIMLTHSTPLRIRPTFLGLWGAIEGLTTVAGPLIGGAITQTIGWRWCFYIAVPLGGATLLLTFFCFEEKVEASSNEAERLTLGDKLKEMDFLSTLILLPALTCLFLAFSWAGTRYPWHSSTIIALLVTSTTLAVIFAYNQIRRGEAAALPIRILKNRTLLTSLTFYYLPIYYQVVQGYTPAQSGLLMLPILLIATVGAILSGFGTSACGYYASFMIFASITMSIAAGLVTTFGVDTNLAKRILYTGVFGLGYGVGSTGPTTAVQTVFLDGDVSIGLSVLLFGSAFGPAVMVSIAQVIFTNQLQDFLSGENAVDERGLTELVRHVSHDRVHEVLFWIHRSTLDTWYLVLALACATLAGSLAIEWRSVKKDDRSKEVEDKPEINEAEVLERNGDITDKHARTIIPHYLRPIKPTSRYLMRTILPPPHMPMTIPNASPNANFKRQDARNAFADRETEKSHPPPSHAYPAFLKEELHRFP